LMANIAPYRLATGIASLLATRTKIRLAAPVTQTPSTAVPLGATGVVVDDKSSCEHHIY